MSENAPELSLDQLKSEKQRLEKELEVLQSDCLAAKATLKTMKDKVKEDIRLTMTRKKAGAEAKKDERVISLQEAFNEEERKVKEKQAELKSVNAKISVIEPVNLIDDKKQDRAESTSQGDGKENGGPVDLSKINSADLARAMNGGGDGQEKKDIIKTFVSEKTSLRGVVASLRGLFKKNEQLREKLGQTADLIEQLDNDMRSMDDAAVEVAINQMSSEHGIRERVRELVKKRREKVRGNRNGNGDGQESKDDWSDVEEVITGSGSLADLAKNLNQWKKDKKIKGEELTISINAISALKREITDISEDELEKRLAFVSEKHELRKKAEELARAEMKKLDVKFEKSKVGKLWREAVDEMLASINEDEIKKINNTLAEGFLKVADAESEKNKTHFRKLQHAAIGFMDKPGPQADISMLRRDESKLVMHLENVFARQEEEFTAEKVIEMAENLNDLAYNLRLWKKKNRISSPDLMKDIKTIEKLYQYLDEMEDGEINDVISHISTENGLQAKVKTLVEARINKKEKKDKKLSEDMKRSGPSLRGENLLADTEKAAVIEKSKDLPALFACLRRIGRIETKEGRRIVAHEAEDLIAIIQDVEVNRAIEQDIPEALGLRKVALKLIEKKYQDKNTEKTEREKMVTEAISRTKNFPELFAVIREIGDITISQTDGKEVTYTANAVIAVIGKVMRGQEDIQMIPYVFGLRLKVQDLMKALAVSNTEIEKKAPLILDKVPTKKLPRTDDMAQMKVDIAGANNEEPQQPAVIKKDKKPEQIHDITTLPEFDSEGLMTVDHIYAEIASLEQSLQKLATSDPKHAEITALITEKKAFIADLKRERIDGDKENKGDAAVNEEKEAELTLKGARQLYALEHAKERKSQGGWFKQKLRKIIRLTKAESEEFTTANKNYQTALRRYANAVTAVEWEIHKNLGGDVSYETYNQLSAKMVGRQIQRIMVPEYRKLKREEAESLPPREKGMIRKALEAYGRVGKFKKILIGSAVCALPALTVSAALFAGVASHRAVRLTVGAFGGSLLSEWYERRKNMMLDEERGEELQKISKDFSIFGDINQVTDLERGFDDKRDRITKQKIGIAALFGGSIGLLDTAIDKAFFHTSLPETQITEKAVSAPNEPIIKRPTVPVEGKVALPKPVEETESIDLEKSFPPESPTPEKAPIPATIPDEVNINKDEVYARAPKATPIIRAEPVVSLKELTNAVGKAFPERVQEIFPSRSFGNRFFSMTTTPGVQSESWMAASRMTPSKLLAMKPGDISNFIRNNNLENLLNRDQLLKLQKVVQIGADHKLIDPQMNVGAVVRKVVEFEQRELIKNSRRIAKI